MPDQVLTLQEKDSAVNELKRLQVSIRATQMDEVSRENKVLLDEVDRLRQMNDVLKKQLAAREETCTGQLTAMKEELQQHKRVGRACICQASEQETWNREGWGYDEQLTAKKMLSRLRCAYDTAFQALSFCVESSASGKLGASERSKNSVEVQIRALMDFLSTQASRYRMTAAWYMKSFCACQVPHQEVSLTKAWSTECRKS